MNHRTDLELEPTAKQCLECGGPILHPLPDPFRIDLVSGAIRNTRRDGDVSRTLSGDLCETCRLERAEGSAAHDALSQELADLRRVRGLLGLGSYPPALQRFTWESTDAYPELQGATLTSYGVWCLSREPLPAGLAMRSHCYGLENGLYLSIIFALEILSLPNHPTQLYSRWDPDTGEEWQELRNTQPGDLGHRKQLLEAMELTWEARKRGRPDGSRTFTLEDVEAAYRSAAEHEPNPAQVVVASYLERSARSLRELLKDLGMDWRSFKKRMQAGA